MKRFNALAVLSTLACVAALALPTAANAACSTWGAQGNTTTGGACTCGTTRAVAMTSQSSPQSGVSKWGTSHSGRYTRVKVLCWNDAGRSVTITSDWTSSTNGARANCPSTYPGAQYAQCMVK
jgi:hypothetical protein